MLQEGRQQEGCRQHDAALGQALAQQLARFFHAPRHRAAGPTQLLGCFLVRFALHAAKDQGRAVFLRQLAQRLIDDRLEVTEVGIRVGFCNGHFQSLPFPRTPFGGHRLGLDGRAKRHGIQPVPQRALAIQRIGPAHKHQKGCLEGILGIMLVLKNPLAHTQDE